MARHRNQGFTLLELMVVLLILGLGAAVATPALVRLADALAERNQQDQIVMLLQNLPVGVMKQGGAFSLPSTSGFVPYQEVFQGAPASLPREDAGSMRVWVPSEIEYRANGACTGGAIHLELEAGKRVTYQLAPPLCRPRIEA